LADENRKEECGCNWGTNASGDENMRAHHEVLPLCLWRI